MKVIVSESLRYNANYIIPLEKNSCVGLLESIFVKDSSDSDFGKKCNAARFVFDEVESFIPNMEKYTEKEAFVVDKIKKIGSHKKDGKPRTIEQLANKILKESFCEWSKDEIQSAIDDLMPTNLDGTSSIVLSPDTFINLNFSRSLKKVTDEASLLLLASSGIDLVLPQIYIKDSEDIQKFKEKFAEERLDYLLYIKDFTSSVSKELSTSSPNLDEIYETAYREFRLDIKLKAERINACAQKEKHRAFAYIKEDALDKAPTIGAALIKLDFIEAGKEIFNVLFSSLKAKKDTKEILKKYQEAAYIYQLKKVHG